MTAPVVERRPAHHSAFLLGKAQGGVDSIVHAIDGGADLTVVRARLVALRVELGDVHASDVAGVDRGRRSERRDDMQALIEAVRS